MNIVSFLVPRPHHPRWGDYISLLKVLQYSCDRFGQRHVVLTDDPNLAGGFELFVRPCRENVMQACHDLQYLWLKEGDWKGEDTLFTGADCLLYQHPDMAFAGDWDVCIPVRLRRLPWLNTGAVVVRQGKAREVCTGVWKQMAIETQDRWGADLAAMADTFGPIPKGYGSVEERFNAIRVAFIDCELINKKPRPGEPFDAAIAHFKGSFGLSKRNMVPWARQHIGYPAAYSFDKLVEDLYIGLERADPTGVPWAKVAEAEREFYRAGLRYMLTENGLD